MSESKLNTIDPKIVSIAAVYWADSVTSSAGGFYTKYEASVDSNSTLGMACGMVVNGTEWAFISTWDKMMPNTGSPYATEVSTFSYVRSVLCL